VNLSRADSINTAGLTVRRVESRLFALQSGAWTDVRYRPGIKSVSVKPYSKAYFDLIEQLPELRAVFALGDRVTVVGRDQAIMVADSGSSELAAGELARIARNW